MRTAEASTCHAGDDPLQTITRIADVTRPMRARAAALRSGRETPGAYMKRCREREGRSIEQVADLIASGAYARARAARDIANLEADVPGEYSQLLHALRDHRAVVFNMTVIMSLASATCGEDLGPEAA